MINNNKKLVYLIIIISFILCSSVSLAGSPKAVISTTEYEFGSVWRGDQVSHSFKILNRGDTDLLIERIGVSSALAAANTRKVIKPGEEGEVMVSMDTAKLTGKVVLDDAVKTNDPEHSEIILTLKGQVKPFFDIQPMSAVFFSLYKGEIKEQFVTIVNNFDTPIKLLRVESKSSRFTTKLETIKEGREYKLHVKVNPDASSGRTREKATIITDNDRVPAVNVGVNIFVKNDVYNFPDNVDFGRISLEQTKKDPNLFDLLKQTVLVKQREGKTGDFQIKLEHDIPFLKISKDPENRAKTYQLDISLIPEKMVKGKIDSFIRVLTSDKDMPEIKIPVTGEIY